MIETLVEIRKGLDLLFEQGDVIELRAPRKTIKSANISGFFDDLGKLVQEIHRVNLRYSRTVYVSLNPLRRNWQHINNQAWWVSA